MKFAKIPHAYSEINNTNQFLIQKPSVLNWEFYT